MELFLEYGRSEFDDVAEYDYQRGKTFELCWGARDMSQQPQLVGLIIPTDLIGSESRSAGHRHNINRRRSRCQTRCLELIEALRASVRDAGSQIEIFTSRRQCAGCIFFDRDHQLTPFNFEVGPFPSRHPKDRDCANRKEPCL
jgi:hypothetical protein